MGIPFRLAHLPEIDQLYEAFSVISTILQKYDDGDDYYYQNPTAQLLGNSMSQLLDAIEVIEGRYKHRGPVH